MSFNVSDIQLVSQWRERAMTEAKAIHSKKEEAYIAGFKEKLGVYVKRWFPRVFSIMIRKLSVT